MGGPTGDRLRSPWEYTYFAADNAQEDLPLRDARKSKRPVPMRPAHNLSLSEEAAALGERYAEHMGISLSRLLAQMLLAPPTGELPDDAEPAPTVARLRRLLARDEKPVDWWHQYREHLEQKYLAQRER